MAYANPNQVVLVPYRQLIDPHYLNRPVAFVQGPAVGPMNPINGPVPPQLIPFNAAVIPPGDFGLNAAVLAPIEEARSRSLLQLMAEEELVPSLEEEIRRRNAIDKLKQIVMEWIKNIARQHRLRGEYISAASATVLTYGSYGLGVHNSESDIDAVCVGPCFATMAEDFFIVLHNMLTNRPEVSDVHCVKDAKVPLMRFKLDGISIDLPYAQLKVMSVPENVDILNPYFLRGIDEISWRSLSGVHANKCILQLLPNIEVFQSLLRCVKLWAKRRGVYGNLFGFFGGVHLAILVAFICQRHPNASLSVLISNFFKTFAFWPWPTPVILQDNVFPMTGSATGLRSLMPIRLPCRPHEYCHSNITKSTFYKIRAEFLRGHTLTKDLLKQDFDWAGLFESFPYTKKYTRFVKIFLLARDQDELGEWVGWVKSRFRSLLLKLEEIQGFCDPNPTEYVDANIVEPNVVFYWGLQPGRNGFVDMKSVKDDFIKSISNGYQVPTRRISLSIVQASQLPKNATFDTESDQRREACYGELDCNQRVSPEFSERLPSNVGRLTTNANSVHPSSGG
ncbi:nuclear poly(A) polymerase 3 [Diospyros lotus]|uniref:nuclear poly(A) polymerase 3 n=1 Tax=Diospyros lotus TaxID=55363 RepID=UPI002251CD64|nr:nuclear poly(A) polymerase 3 [Diospyros lotus]